MYKKAVDKKIRRCKRRSIPLPSTIKNNKKYRVAQKTYKFDIDSTKNEEVKNLCKDKITENIQYYTSPATDIENKRKRIKKTSMSRTNTWRKESTQEM